MGNIKDFAVATEVLEDTNLEFSLNGIGKYVIYKPSPSQVALLAGAIGESSNDSDAVSTVMRFLKETLHEDSYQEIRNRLWGSVPEAESISILDDDDSPGLLSTLFQIVEHFSGRPTPPSTGSSSSQPAGGRRSTGRRQESTPEPSTSSGSATTSSRGPSSGSTRRR